MTRRNPYAAPPPRGDWANDLTNEGDHEFKGLVKFTKGKAVLMEVDGKEIWLPKSLVEELRREGWFSVPVWLARKKEML